MSRFLNGVWFLPLEKSTSCSFDLKGGHVVSLPPHSAPAESTSDVLRWTRSSRTFYAQKAALPTSGKLWHFSGHVAEKFNSLFTLFPRMNASPEPRNVSHKKADLTRPEVTFKAFLTAFYPRAPGSTYRDRFPQVFGGKNQHQHWNVRTSSVSPLFSLCVVASSSF